MNDLLGKFGMHEMEVAASRLAELYRAGKRVFGLQDAAAPNTEVALSWWRAGYPEPVQVHLDADVVTGFLHLVGYGWLVRGDYNGSFEPTDLFLSAAGLTKHAAESSPALGSSTGP